MTQARQKQPIPNQVSYLVALAIVLLADLNMIERSVLRTICPVGACRTTTGGKRINTVSHRFLDSLAQFERAGWIRRCPKGMIEIIDRESLRRWLLTAHLIDSNPDRTRQRIQTALDKLDRAGLLAKSRQAHSARKRAQDRQAELRELGRLMKQPPGRRAPGY